MAGPNNTVTNPTHTQEPAQPVKRKAGRPPGQHPDTLRIQRPPRMTPEELAEIRKHLGLSYRKLARMLGLLDYMIVSRWEHGFVPIPRYMSLCIRLLALVKGTLAGERFGLK